MNTLVIKKRPNAVPAVYTAELNGIQLPNIRSIAIETGSGNLPEITIKIIATNTPSTQFIIEGMEL